MNLSLTKKEIQQLIKAGREGWIRLGQLFEFEPVFMPLGQGIIDWRCVPERMYSILIRPHVEKPKHLSHFDRTYDQQSGICHFCHKKIMLSQWSIDHLTPTSRGGNNSHRNLVGCCRPCNHGKGSMTEEEYFTIPAGMRKEWQRLTAHKPEWQLKLSRPFLICQEVYKPPALGNLSHETHPD